MIWEIEKLVRKYEKSLISRSDVIGGFMDLLSKSGSSLRWGDIPAEFQGDILKWAGDLPHDEVGWGNLKIFNISGCPKSKTPSQLAEDKEKLRVLVGKIREKIKISEE